MNRHLAVAITVILLGALNLPASEIDTRLTSDRVFEITQQLYERFADLPKACSADNVTFSVMFDGTQ